MGYRGNQDRFGSDRERGERETWGGGDRYGESGRGRRGERDYGGDEDRGFFERAADEVRSWFGDEDEERGRRERGWRGEDERESRGSERGPGWRGDESFAGGWGNQTPRAERLGDREGREWRDDLAPERYGGAIEEGYGSGESFGTSSPDPDAFHAAPGHDAEFAGPRFDRADIGSTGTHGVHPVASASGAAYHGYGASAGGFRSSARRYAMMNRDRGRSGGGHPHDPHYSEWRRRQIEQLDRDYQEYCRERQSRFDEDFGAWRERRNQQRSTWGKVREHMAVLGSDGEHVGTVDKVAGDRIILTKNDPSASGMHHSIPCSWIDSVEEDVRLNRSAEEARKEWREEEHNRALFEREGEEDFGPRTLDRSFSGTY
ncbi:MAG: DUF2171 domain-containing protein [Pseudomonadota bacterium]|nr:DUF2171 domain-containing protein [Pseudomonadota bacterium]